MENRVLLTLYRVEAGRFASRLKARPKDGKEATPNVSRRLFCEVICNDDFSRMSSEVRCPLRRTEVVGWKARDFRSQG
jgi:hypothetical protein